MSKLEKKRIFFIFSALFVIAAILFSINYEAICAPELAEKLAESRARNKVLQDAFDEMKETIDFVINEDTIGELQEKGGVVPTKGKKFRVIFPESWHFMHLCRIKFAIDSDCFQNEEIGQSLQKIVMRAEAYNSVITLSDPKKEDTYVFVADVDSFQELEDFEDIHGIKRVYEKFNTTNEERLLIHTKGNVYVRL
jgi:hypothetical protein